MKLEKCLYQVFGSKVKMPRIFDKYGCQECKPNEKNKECPSYSSIKIREYKVE